MGLVIQQVNFQLDIGKLVLFAAKHSILMTAGSSYRDRKTQARLVKDGKSRTYNSNHLRRLAQDFNFFYFNNAGALKLTYAKKHIQFLGDYWESLSPWNRWGGNFKSFLDTPHFERKPE
jgi:hypothetical protein